MASTVKNLPAMQETWVRSLSREDPLEKRMAAHSSTRDWRIPWTEEPYSPWGRKEMDTTERLSLSVFAEYLNGFLKLISSLLWRSWKAENIFPWYPQS